MRRDKLGDRILGNAVNIAGFAVFCFFIGWWSIAGGVMLGGEWGDALDEFMEQMWDSTVAEATLTILGLIVKCLFFLFVVFMFSGCCMMGLVFLAGGWPFDEEAHDGRIRPRATIYLFLLAVVAVVATVATIVSIWKSVFWDIDNKEFALTCLASLAPIVVCAWWFFILWKIFNEK